jgi:uncharacterized Zn-binding protein involved in type VI secretion
MSLPAATIGSLGSGHDAHPPRPATTGSGDVFINGKAAHRQGDEWALHVRPKGTPHGGTLAAGSSTVFVNGKALGRLGDPVSCGSAVASGSSNVFVGG